MIESEQLDIFIPLQRRDRFDEWARLARENDVDFTDPGRIPAFAEWLRESGHAPAGISMDALTVLVAVMRDYLGSSLFEPAAAGP